MLSRRSLLAGAGAVGAGAGLLPLRHARAAPKPAAITIDWATYNPVSMVLKQQGLLEKEFAKDGIGIRWVQTLGSNKALEFLNAGSIDFGSTAAPPHCSPRSTATRSNRSTCIPSRSGPRW